MNLWKLEQSITKKTNPETDHEFVAATGQLGDFFFNLFKIYKLKKMTGH